MGGAIMAQAIRAVCIVKLWQAKIGDSTMEATRAIVAMLFCLALQSNEAAAWGRSEIDMNVEVLASKNAGQEELATIEAQDIQLALGAFTSAEIDMTDSAMRSMTISKALEIIQHKNGTSPDAIALIKHQLERKAPGYAGVQKGQDMLNEMIQETIEKLDLERQTCATFIKTQKHQIWVTVQDIRMYDARAAGAREDVLAAQTEIERLTELLPKLMSTLEAHNRKCAEDIAGLEEQLKIVRGDITVMTSVLKLTECDSTSALLQHGVLRTTVAKMKSGEARHHLQDGLDDACTGDMPLETPDSPDALVQVSANPTIIDPTKQRSKCTLSKNSCKKLRDKFLQIQSGIEAKRDELMAELSMVRRHCEDEKSNLESQISDAETDLKNQQTSLAKATKEQNDAERNSKIKNEERTALIAELERMTKLCEVNINNLVSEKCALGKIRGELETMKGHTNPAFLQDCEVTDWSADECSATCDGGIQKLTRAISVHPVGGAECPPLEMQRACGEEECPINCELEDWTEWGDCSAECNGGVKEKIRNVLKVPQFGGDPCGESSVAESCNMQSCDKDCVLGDWTGWSECSKECDGGLNTRVKTVVEEPHGDGDCFHAETAERLEYSPCNVAKCEGNVTCESKLDVVILLDGSGSLGPNGWEQTKKAGEMFVQGLHGGESHVKVSVILFSGPTSWNKYYACTGATKGATPNLKDDCGIDIVQHFTADMGEAANVISGLAWPAKTTLTSQALMTAKSELSLGRKDASSVVVVITDGRPLNPKRTQEASSDLRKSARLMWIPVGRNVPIKDMKEWASTPMSENVMAVDNFEALSDPETISAFLVDMCPKVKLTKEPASPAR